MSFITRCNPSCISNSDQPYDIRITSIAPAVDHAAHLMHTWILNLANNREPAVYQNGEQPETLNLGTTVVPNTRWEYLSNGVEIECTRSKAFLNSVDCAVIPGSALLCCRIPPFVHYSDPLGASQCILYADVRSYLDKRPEFGRDPPLLDSPTRPYVIRNSQLGGRGIFAKRDLNVGDLIMVERPLIVMPIDELSLAGVWMHRDVVPAQGFSTPTWHKFNKSLFDDALRLAFNRMSKKSRHAFMNLHNAFPNKRQSELSGIFETNSFSCGRRGDFGPKNYHFSATYKTMARLNHSCTPNSTALFDLNTFSGHLRATRPIRENEEIFIKYRSVMLHPIAKERQSKYEEMGFRCSNPCCFDSSDLAHSSLKSLYENLSYLERELPSVFPQDMHTMSTLLLLWMSAKGLDGLEQYAEVLFMHVKATDELSKLVATTREKENLEKAVKMWKKLSHKYSPLMM